MESLSFLTDESVRTIAEEYGTPVFVYDEATLRDSAGKVMNFPNAYGLTARYAMKANPNSTIVRILSSCGLHIDASSGYEVERARMAGVPAANILLSSQELAHNLKEIVEEGVNINACSLRQLEAYGELFPGGDIGIRFNPGLGSGGTQRTNVGGPASSFGIWHEEIEAVCAIVAKHNLNVVRIHTHIGSGSDAEVWQRVAGMSIQLLEHFPSASVLNLGGGYKVGRMADEVSTDLQAVGPAVVDVFRDFASKTGREIRLEVEPGTFLLANAGAVISTIDDVTNTGADGYRFYKTDTGMTDVLRPSLYGAQHPLICVARDDKDTSKGSSEVLVVGHCCESGDILTPKPGDPEGLAPREVRDSKIGDYVVIEGVGAYCSAMSAKNYNSFPESPEVLLRTDGTTVLIRKKQTLEQIIGNEVSVSL
jgi:diaminopimelate decarboxylase